MTPKLAHQRALKHRRALKLGHPAAPLQPARAKPCPNNLRNLIAVSRPGLGKTAAAKTRRSPPLACTDAIEDAGQTYDKHRGAFGVEVAGIVRDCTDTSEGLAADNKGALAAAAKNALSGFPLSAKPRESSLRVTAADKAHNARTWCLDARSRSKTSWVSLPSRPSTASAWYLPADARRPSATAWPGKPLQRAAGKGSGGRSRQTSLPTADAHRPSPRVWARATRKAIRCRAVARAEAGLA